MSITRRYPNRLKMLRTKHKRSQQDVADALGTSVATISRHESGDRGVDREWIERYKKYYGVESHEIFIYDRTAR